MTPKEAVKEFEDTKGMAELRALSDVSLSRPLSDQEYKRMMELKSEVLGL